MSDNLPEQLHAPSTAVERYVGRDANTELSPEDVTLPRMKLGQFMSTAVKRRRVNVGDVYLYMNQDDPNPVVLAAAPEGGGETKPVRFYVLGFRKGFSYKDKADKLQQSKDGSYPDLSLVKGGDPYYVKRTFDYVVVIPAYPDLPVKFLMDGKWGGQAAKSLNSRLLVAKMQGVPQHTVPFKLQGGMTSNDKGEFAYAIVGVDNVPAKDKAKDLELVNTFFELFGTGIDVPDADVIEAEEQAGATVDLPAVD